MPLFPPLSLSVFLSRAGFRWVLCCAPLLLGACAITRVDAPKPAAPPAQFKETALWQRADPAPPGAVPDAWWQLFNDPVLNDLQARLVVGNENLRNVAAQVASARATVDASRAALWPSLSFGPSVTRSRSGSIITTPAPGAAPVSTSRAPTNQISLGGNASWDLDLWDRLSQARDASSGSYQASLDDLAAARLSAQATLVQSYFALRAAEAQQLLLDRSTAAYQRSLSLTQARYQSGVAAQSDVLQAQTQLRSAQVQGSEATAQRAQLEHSIAVLLGQPPSSLQIAPTGSLPEPPAVPELLPATLLQRRPDIAAAERRVAAAYAQIGVADAAFFPSLTLSASGGYRGTTLSDLISTPNLFWSVGASLSQAIFDGGQRKLASAQARAAADQATSTYRQTVLTSLQEVEDNLVLADRLRTEAVWQRDALDYAQRTLAITEAQYRAGTVGYLNVVTAQASALTAEQTLLSVRNRQLAAVNLLLKNVAGRWQ
jgi:NodT family efflux transporter outer membrane factor (OMF) lipoprotein